MTDISKFYPSLLARDKILISANPCWNSQHILASMIYFLNKSSSYLIMWGRCWCCHCHKYRITVLGKVETDISTSITASLIWRAVIPVTMYVETSKLTLLIVSVMSKYVWHHINWLSWLVHWHWKYSSVRAKQKCINYR